MGIERLVRELEQESYLVSKEDPGMVIIMAGDYVVTLLGEDLTQIRDRDCFENFKGDVLKEVSGIPNSVEELESWLGIVGPHA